VLVLTAQVGELREHPETTFQHFVIELAVLMALILALAPALVWLRKKGPPGVAKRE
jgi:hypothetical protein